MSTRADLEVGGAPWRAAVLVAAAGLIVAGGSIGGPGVGVAAAQPPAAEGGFTADQAAAGWAVYARQCGECHGAGLDGAEAPALRGVDFLNGWAGQTTDELFAYVRGEMPPGLGGSLGDQVYLNLVAYILDMNGARPGDAPLAADAAVMIGDAADVAEARRAAREGDRPRRRATRFVNREVPHDLTPVTDALLADPPPADWLSWRRTRNGHGYSPLDEVTRDNVDELRLAWVLAIREGNHQTSAAGARRRDVPGQSGGRRAGDRRGHRRRPLAVPVAAARGCAAAGADPHPGPLRRPGVPRHRGRGPRRPRRADRRGRVADGQGRLHAGLPPERRPRHRRRRRRHRHQRVSALQGADLLHHRARPGHRRGAVADVDDRPARRSERRVVGRHAAVSARGRRPVDSRQLRRRPRPLLHRHRAGQAVGGREPRHEHAAGRALHQFDAGPEPAHRAGGVVLPACAGRDPRPRHRLRARSRRRRRGEVALHDREGRHPLEARPADRGVRRPAGNRLSGRLRVDRPDHRRPDLPPGHSRRGHRRPRARLSQPARRPQLAGVGVPPRGRRPRESRSTRPACT